MNTRPLTDIIPGRYWPKPNYWPQQHHHHHHCQHFNVCTCGYCYGCQRYVGYRWGRPYWRAGNMACSHS